MTRLTLKDTDVAINRSSDAAKSESCVGKWSLCGAITGGNDAVWGDTPKEWEHGLNTERFSQEYLPPACSWTPK